MDVSLAKGFTKEFFRQLPINLKNRLNEITPLFQNSKNKSRFVSKLNNSLSKDANNFAIHHAEFGSKRKPKIAFTVLELGDYHKSLDRYESLLIGEQFVFHSDPLRIFHTGKLQFIISHHVIQRIFQRNPEIKTLNFNQSFKIIKDELKYLNFWTLVWNTLFSNTTFKKEDVQNVNFPIPTDKGLMYGQFPSGDRYLDVRTYISNEMLNENQTLLKNNMIKICNPFLKNHLNYFFYSKEIDYDEEMQEFELLFQYILFHINSDLKKILPEMISYKNRSNEIDNIIKTTIDAISFLSENIDVEFNFSKSIYKIKNKNVDFLYISRAIKKKLKQNIND